VQSEIHFPTNKFVGYDYFLSEPPPCPLSEWDLFQISNYQIELWIPTFVGMTAKLSYKTTSSVSEPSEGFKPSEGLLFHCHSRANGNHCNRCCLISWFFGKY